MIPLILLGAAAALLIAVYWKKLAAWLGRVAEKIKSMLPNSVVEGFKTFCAKISGVIKNISKSYAKDQITGQWEETIMRTSVEENEVPEEFRERVRNNEEVETSEMLINQLHQK